MPIHIYTLPWAPKPDWTRYMASGEEILQYVRDVNRKFQLDRWIRFDTSLDEAVWDEAAGKWKLAREYARFPNGCCNAEGSSERSGRSIRRRV